MSTTTLAAPIPVNTSGLHARPRLGRLVAVELRKMVDTRAGFWLQAAMVALTVVVVVVRLLVSSPGVEGTWSDAAPLIGQSAVNLTAGIVVGVALGAILLAPTPAIVLHFAPEPVKPDETVSSRN